MADWMGEAALRAESAGRPALHRGFLDVDPAYARKNPRHVQTRMAVSFLLTPESKGGVGGVAETAGGLLVDNPRMSARRPPCCKVFG